MKESKKKTHDDSSRKSSLEYIGIENAPNAYHQRNQNALILMENLYRNEIKCRMLWYEPSKRLGSPFRGISLVHSVRRTRRCNVLRFVVCAVLDGDDSCESAWFCLGRSHPSLSCTFNASLSHSASFRLVSRSSSRLCRHCR